MKTYAQIILLGLQLLSWLTQIFRERGLIKDEDLRLLDQQVAEWSKDLSEARAAVDAVRHGGGVPTEGFDPFDRDASGPKTGTTTG